MTQQCTLRCYTGIVTLQLPSAATEVVPGVHWGNVMERGTPAHRVRNLLTSRLETPRGAIPLTNSLAQTVGNLLVDCDGGTQCPLVREAAYMQLDAMGAFSAVPPTAAQLMDWLASPLALKDHQTQVYRLNPESAHKWSCLLHHIASAPVCRNARALRDWLATVAGMSWEYASLAIHRFVEPSDIAVIDLYGLQNGQLIGLFPLDASIEQDYAALERRLLTLCSELAIAPGELLRSLCGDSEEHRSVVAQRVEVMQENACQRATETQHVGKRKRSAVNQVHVNRDEAR